MFNVAKSYVGRTFHPLNVYPVLVGIVDGGVNVESYVQSLDALSTSINVLLLYQYKLISFACQPASRFDVPEYTCNGVYLQSAVDALDDISVANNGAEIKIEIAKQIVPICFGLSNRLHVCVCVCVCVAFCGFAPICQLLSNIKTYLSPFLL